LTFEYGPDRADFWDDYVDRVGWGIPGGEDSYQEFLNDAPELSRLFDIWSDPNEDDARQHEAYGDFWQILAEYGLDLDSFDWVSFREEYSGG
jgi:hypothetical protein